jgi:hypothetical protein
MSRIPDGRSLLELGRGAHWRRAFTGEGTTSATGAVNAYVTRMHVRYDAASFPEDLTFVETADRENFQGRYILRHPYQAAASCPAGDAYRDALPGRFKQEAETLAGMTG